jgi:hypothetical protein
MALMALTSTPDTTLLALLRARAIPALIDVARWQAPGHATPGLVILGRIAGMSEDAIADAIARGDRERIIATVRR